MDIVTKRAKHEKKIMQIIDDQKLTDRPAEDFTSIKHKLLEQDLLNDHNLTFAKEYFTAVMLKTKIEV